MLSVYLEKRKITNRTNKHRKNTNKRTLDQQREMKTALVNCHHICFYFCWLIIYLHIYAKWIWKRLKTKQFSFLIDLRISFAD